MAVALDAELTGRAGRRWAVLPSCLVALLCGLCLATGARAATIEHWRTPDPRFIDPATSELQSGQLITSVVLPAGYRQRRCWPVLYLLHGTQAGTQPAALQWLQLAHGAVLRMHIPAILVIPGSGDSWYINDWFGGERHPAFESWMLQDIVPLVSRRLHVCRGRSAHSIAGLSMGGYGAVYLASQLPGYFGSAGAFSAPLSPQSSNFRRYLDPEFPDYWGPAGRFYAVAHDPMALLANLRHTRVFVGVGNGRVLPGEADVASLSTEETEFEQESIAYVRRARRTGVAVTFDRHLGQHTDLTWLRSLSDMLAWHPFHRVVAHPRDWTFSTVQTSGSAWGYHFAFPADSPPLRIIRLAMRSGTLQVTGAGTVTITTPSGARVSGQIPFAIRSGAAIATPGAAPPRLRGGEQHVRGVSVSAGPSSPDETTPLQLSFTPRSPLPRGEEYQVGRIALSDTTGSCDDNVLQRIGGLAPGRRVTETLEPPSTATFPGRWCAGPAVLALSEVPTGAPATVPGTILGIARVTITG